MSSPLRRYLVGCLLLSCAAPALADDTPKPTGGAERSTWFMYFGDHPLSANYALHLEGQYRRQGLGQRWEQLLLRPGLDRNFGKHIKTMLAYTYLRGYPFEGGTLGAPSTTGPQPEHRILEELTIKHHLNDGGGNPEKAVQISHRLRAEQRWSGVSADGIGTTDWEFGERARYRLTADIPFRWNTAAARPDYTSVYNEVFVNFGPHGTSNALDQDRTYGALGWDLSPNFQLEVGYLFQYQPEPNGIIGTANHALQITINSTAPLRHLLGH